MLTTITLLAAASGALRLGLNWVVWRRFGVFVTLPQLLAVALVVLASMPGILQPVPWPLPLSVTVGLLLPDLLLRRR